MKHYVYLFIFFLCSPFFAKAYTAPAGVYDLRCQYLQDPVGIDQSHPAFSWKLSAVGRAVMQTAYQVIVASSPQQLDHDPDIWNSGKVSSDQNTFIYYNGRPLSSAHKYYWKVKVWTNDGRESANSKPAYFITGLMQQEEWKDAAWIGYEALPDSLKVFPGVHGNGDQLGNRAKTRSIVPYFRKELIVKKTIRQALVYVSGQGQYALYLNGHRLDSSSFLNPAWSDYTKRCYYNTYDISSDLKQGRNVIGAIVGNGFLYINRERYRKLVIAAGYPMLRMKIIVQYTDGTTDEIVTDDTWKTAPSPVTYSGTYGGEDFDANKIQEGWSTPSFNDAQWRSSVIVPGPGGVMQAQEAYPVVVTQKFLPQQIYSSVKRLRVYDFGQNMSGIVHLKVRGLKGYRVRIIPAELLNEDHTPDQRATGQPYYWEYTLKGNGTEDWQPLFSYYGFRYAGVEVLDTAGAIVDLSAVKIDSLIALHTQNAAPPAGTFACSSPLFNKIFKLIWWGISNNMSNVATDCPHREKLGWLEETHLIGSSIQYNYDILRFYNKIIDDMIDAQQPDGLVPDIAPEYVVFADGFRDSPEWGSACVLVPWYLYEWYGDKAALQRSYDMMKRYVAYLGSKATSNLLAYGLGDWFDLGPKPPGVSQLTPLGLTATAFYFYDASVLSQVAAVLGDTSAMQQYSSLAGNIRRSFNQKYFDPATGVYATGSQTAYALPLYVGLVDTLHYAKVLANLIDTINAGRKSLTAGDIGFRYLVQVLEQNNAGQLIYEMNSKDDVPGYGYQLRLGATALTESWQALRNVSNDHMMLGHLMEWLYGGLAGIRQQPGSTGFRKILIAPQWVEGINWVSSTYQSVNGPIGVSWKRTGAKQIRLQVTIPANTTAKIVLPLNKIALIRESNRPLKIKANGILQVDREKDNAVIVTGSGKYDFSFPLL